MAIDNKLSKFEVGELYFPIFDEDNQRAKSAHVVRTFHLVVSDANRPIILAMRDRGDLITFHQASMYAYYLAKV